MRSLSDLIIDIKTEIRKVPMQNTAVLTILGAEIAEQVENMIGTRQLFWKDLAQSTIEKKEQKHWGRNGDAGSPLYATGDFQRSIQYKLVSKNAVMIFSNDPTAEYHEYGTVGVHGQPPRPVFKPAALIVLRQWYAKRRLEGFYLRSLR